MPAKPQWTETTTTTAIICLLLSCNVYKTFLFNRKSITYFKISTYGTLSISVKYIRIILSSYQPCTSTCLLKAILYLIFHLFSFLKLILSQFCIDHVIWRSFLKESERERESVRLLYVKTIIIHTSSKHFIFLLSHSSLLFSLFLSESLVMMNGQCLNLV